MSEEVDLLCCLLVIEGRIRRLEALLETERAELARLEAGGDTDPDPEPEASEPEADAPLPEAPGNGYDRRLTVAQVLSWADAHQERTGSYPAIKSGFIPEAPDLRWRSIDMALRYGALGLPRDLSLSRLLQQHRDWKGRGRRKREA